MGKINETGDLGVPRVDPEYLEAGRHLGRLLCCMQLSHIEGNEQTALSLPHWLDVLVWEMVIKAMPIH